MLTVFGIRHHGVGCARALVSALEEYQPDLILIEGPPEGEVALPYVADTETRPPVAMLVNAIEDVSRAAFYPFASFSPEWVALRYAAATKTTVNFIDLPCAISFALDKREEEAIKARESEETDDETEEEKIDEGANDEEAQSADETLAQEILDDPIGSLARLSGATDPQAWEERAIEEATTPGAIFPAFLDATTALRLAVRDARQEASTTTTEPDAQDSDDEAARLERLAQVVARRSGGSASEREMLREASMRAKIREAIKSNAQRIAVVCGAWHAPVLDLETDDPQRKSLQPTAKEDAALLAKLPRMKTATTWIPWTYSRLARRSGYGSGVTSPGWLDGLWVASPEAARFERLCGGDRPRSALINDLERDVDEQTPDEQKKNALNELNGEELDEQTKQIVEAAASVAQTAEERDRRTRAFAKLEEADAPTRPIVAWTARAARPLRKEGFEQVSSANTIEAIRLADALAAIRDRANPGLAEAREAILTVLCQGREEPLVVINKRLEVGYALGSVPSSVPTTPLERDLEAQSKRFRLTRSELEKLVKLDLRKEFDCEKSAFFHRLTILDVPWALYDAEESQSTGTFREAWKLRWDPELAINVIEASRYGSSLFEAASNAALAQLEKAACLAETLAIFERALNARIAHKAFDSIYRRLQDDAALTTAPDELFDALAAFARILQFGDARRSDLTRLREIFGALFERALVALPGACVNLDDERALARVAQLNGLHAGIVALNDVASLEKLHAAMRAIAESDDASRIVSGRFARVLLEQRKVDDAAFERLLGLFLSTSAEPLDVAQWLRGFLLGSGQTTLWLDSLWARLDSWLGMLDDEGFVALVPLLRRAFADFSAAERRQMGKNVAKLCADKRPAAPKAAQVDSTPVVTAQDDSEQALQDFMASGALSFLVQSSEAPSNDEPKETPEEAQKEAAEETPQDDDAAESLQDFMSGTALSFLNFGE